MSSVRNTIRATIRATIRNAIDNPYEEAVAGSGITAAMPDALLYLASSPGTDDDFQIAFTDTGANTSYTVAISIDSTGVLTYNNTTSLTGSGSGTNTTSYSGSEAVLEAKTITVSGLTDEVATITWSITGDQDAQSANGTFAVGALPDLETTSIDETVLDGTDIFPSLTTALSGSAATVSSSQTIYDRPFIYDLLITDNFDATFDISFQVDIQNGTQSASDTVYYVVTTDTTALSDETNATWGDDIADIIAGNDLSGTATAVEASGSQALTASGTQTISGITPTAGVGTYSIFLVIVQDETDGTEALKGHIELTAISMSDGFLLLEDGTSKLLLEDGTSGLGLE